MKKFKRISREKFFELCPDFGQLRHWGDDTIERKSSLKLFGSWDYEIKKRKMTFGVNNPNENTFDKWVKNEKIKPEIENNLIDYYANSISTSDFIKKHISKFVELNKEKEQKIFKIIAESQRDWDKIECDAEGATKEQDLEMDAHIENVVLEILKILG